MLWSNSSFGTDICSLTSVPRMILWRYDGCLLKWCSVSVGTRWPVRGLSISQAGKQTSPSVRVRGDKKSDKNKNDKVCKAFLSSKQLITQKGLLHSYANACITGKRHLVMMAYACNPSQHSGNLKPTLSQVERKTKQHPVDTPCPCVSQPVQWGRDFTCT